MKKTVAIIVDVEGWALEHIAKDLRSWFGECEYDISIISWHPTFDKWEPEKIRSFLFEFDILWPFCLFEANKVNALGLPYITTVHMAPATTKLDTPRDEVFELYARCFKRAGKDAAALSTISPLLMKVWGSQRDVRRVTVGASPSLFYPPMLKSKPSETLRVGWVGNPEKAYKRCSIIWDAVRGMDGVELYPVLWKGLGTGSIPKTRSQMARYYQEEIDVLVCTSDHEGLPTPAVEASLCGVPIVSVDVGIISELVEQGETGFVILQEAEDLARALRILVEEPETLRAMSEKIAAKALSLFSWEHQFLGWLEFLREGDRALRAQRGRR